MRPNNNNFYLKEQSTTEELEVHLDGIYYQGYAKWLMETNPVAYAEELAWFSAQYQF